MTRTNTWVPLAQWLAILAMSQEHAIKFIWPDSPAVPWAILVGRIAFPLFAGMVAWHLLHNTRHPLRYGCRLLLVGLVAQLPYALVVTPDKLNVCFTLGLGLLAVVLLVRLEERTLQLAAGLTLVMLALAAHPWIEYGLPGLLLVPAFALAFRYPRHTAAALPLLFASTHQRHPGPDGRQPRYRRRATPAGQRVALLAHTGPSHTAPPAALLVPAASARHHPGHRGHHVMRGATRTAGDRRLVSGGRRICRRATVVNRSTQASQGARPSL
ncbi:TraX family protein [Salinicola tamaricis]|uniref:TraX family protein n=1 Tax=Salinicola tamaricis TaxID=1771309 RepID=UPI000D09DF63|nr:TraX family protein [Salinicola tamaricis]